MFQFAAGYSIARRHNYNLVVCPAFYHNKLKLWVRTILELESRQFLLPQILCWHWNILPFKKLLKQIKSGEVFLLNEQSATPEIIENLITEGKDFCMVGYWQSPKWFKGYEEEIRSFYDPIISFSSEFKEFLKNSDKNVVGIHIRRGDFLKNKFIGACKADYYRKAIEIAEASVTHPIFYVVTNDLEWSRKQIQTNQKTIFFSPSHSKYPDLEAFCLMAHSKGLILSNSTFSWWAAFLSLNKKQIVIAPKRWFLKQEFQHRIDSSFFNDWIFLENSLEIIDP